MSSADSGTSTPADRPLKPLWNDARRRMAQLENSASKMSSTWFLGMTGLIVAAALFVLSALILAGCLARLNTHFGMAQHAESVLSELSELQEDLDEAAAAARGFVATKDARLYQSREAAKRRIHQRLTAVATMIGGDEVAQRKMLTVTPLVSRRVNLFDRLVALSKQANTAPAVQAGENERIELVREINLQMAALRDHERDKINSQQRLVHFDIRLAMTLALITAFVAPACGLAGIFLLQRERTSQQARELQRELMHVQRLGIMGETAAMLAHEVKQPLTAATNFVAALRRTLHSAPDKAPALIDRIAQQIQRADTIVRKLRRFIEKREAEKSLETPDVLIDDAITLLGTIDGTITLRTELADNPPAILVDRVQLQQVLVNLMRNAIEAMHDSPRRELKLSTATLESNQVEISLSDTGPGLAAEVAERLFQPFVSTKPNGMGVGLSICQTIIAQHGGRIWAEPNPGGGTVFRFTLPAVEERAVA